MRRTLLTAAVCSFWVPGMWAAQTYGSTQTYDQSSQTGTFSNTVASNLNQASSSCYVAQNVLNQAQLAVQQLVNSGTASTVQLADPNQRLSVATSNLAKCTNSLNQAQTTIAQTQGGIQPGGQAQGGMAQGGMQAEQGQAGVYGGAPSGTITSDINQASNSCQAALNEVSQAQAQIQQDINSGSTSQASLSNANRRLVDANNHLAQCTNWVNQAQSRISGTTAAGAAGGMNAVASNMNQAINSCQAAQAQLNEAESVIRQQINSGTPSATALSGADQRLVTASNQLAQCTSSLNQVQAAHMRMMQRMRGQAGTQQTYGTGTAPSTDNTGQSNPDMY